MKPQSAIIKTFRVRRDVEELVSFRLTKDMKNKVNKMAEEAGMTRSEFLRVGIETWLSILQGKKLNDDGVWFKWDSN